MHQLTVDRMKDGKILPSGDFGHITQRVHKTPYCTFRIIEMEFDGKCKDEFRIKFATRPENMLLNYCNNGIFLFERRP
ncbi:MAG TPA: hypothetical protein VGZ71_00015, partial [Puia sp.]|nr:hypothetical protein [Puia sp.]